MGHGEEPLTATYKNQRPPWVGLWSSREYKGRPDWWTEAGMKDEEARNGRLRLRKSRFREEDPDWFDAKVPDGTSLAGPFGLDSSKIKNLTRKGDQVGNAEDFSKKVMQQSVQYKQIAEKFELSKEHPGLAVNPDLTGQSLIPLEHLGRNSFLPLGQRVYTFGPGFFDTPLNEGAFWKGLAATKYTAIALLPYTMLHLKNVGKFNPYDTLTAKNYIKRYLQVSPLPLSVAFAWGFSLSAAATIRNKDDVYNHFYASAAVGAVVSSFRGNASVGVVAAIASTVLGVFWQYQRCSKHGLQLKTPHTAPTGIWGGPLVQKLMNFGDKQTPQEFH